MSHEHPHGEHEAFPRHAVAELVAAEDQARAQQNRWQLALFTLALFLLALAWPTRELQGDGVHLIARLDRGAWLDAGLGTALCVRALAWATSLDLERASFLISALSFAVALPLLGSALWRAGFGRGASLAAAALALLCPLAWSVGTLPGYAGPSLALGCALFRSLAPSLNAAPIALGELKSVLLAALLFDVRAIFLAPAVVLALSTDPERGLRAGHVLAAMRRLGSVWRIWLVILVVVCVLPDGSGETGGVWSSALALWSGVSEIGGFGRWRAVVWVSLGLGLGLLALLDCLRFLEPQEDSPPPPWLWTWALVPVTQALVLGSGSLAGLAVGLVPLVAVCAASLLGRRESRRTWPIVFLLVLQCLFLFLGWRPRVAKDRHAPWRAEALRVLRANDLVLCGEAAELHLVRHRFGLEALDLGLLERGGEALRPERWSKILDAAKEARSADRRVVGAWETRGAPLTDEEHAELLSEMALVRLRTP